MRGNTCSFIQPKVNVSSGEYNGASPWHASTATLTIARVRTVASWAWRSPTSTSRCSSATGLPSFTIVGLADKAVAESRERVRAALGAMGLALPPRRITVNLAPADLAKEGSHFDLPIALGLLIVMGVLPADTVEQHLVLGELALDGGMRGVAGRAAGGGRGGRARPGPDLPGGLRRARRRGSRTRSRSWPPPACSP